jgi:flagellar motility protein MotE (MotC chaperone)
MRNFIAKEKIKLKKYYTNRPILEDHMSMHFWHDVRMKQREAEIREIRKETSDIKAEIRRMRKNHNAKSRRRLKRYHEYIKHLPHISSHTGKLYDSWKAGKDGLIWMFAEDVANKDLFQWAKNER